MPVHPCPICKRLIPVGVPYCDSCRPIAEARAAEARQHWKAQYNKAYNSRRDPKYAAFYRCKDWKTLSRTKLQDCRYKCEAGLEGCKGLAVEVHHIKPIKTQEGWDRRFDWDNLMGVCITCHNILDGKTFKKKKEMQGVLNMKEIMNKIK